MKRKRNNLHKTILKIAIDNDMSMNEMAIKIGVSYSFLSSVLAGRCKLNPKFLSKLALMDIPKSHKREIIMAANEQYLIQENPQWEHLNKIYLEESNAVEGMRV